MSQTTHPSEMEFDLALLDGPSGSFSEHVAGCGRCRERLERLRAEQSAFRQGEEPRRAARLVAARLHDRTFSARFRRWLWIPTVAGTALAAALLMLRPTEIRTKGGPSVSLFVKRDGAPPVRWDGAPLDEGDAVQLAIDPVGFSRAAVFSVDESCAASLEHEHLDGAGLIGASWTLRGRRGGERLYVTFSTRPVAATELSAALRASGACDPNSAPDVQTPELVARGIALRAGGRR